MNNLVITCGGRQGCQSFFLLPVPHRASVNMRKNGWLAYDAIARVAGFATGLVTVPGTEEKVASFVCKDCIEAQNSAAEAG